MNRYIKGNLDICTRKLIWWWTRWNSIPMKVCHIKFTRYNSQQDVINKSDMIWWLPRTVHHCWFQTDIFDSSIKNLINIELSDWMQTKQLIIKSKISIPRKIKFKSTTKWFYEFIQKIWCGWFIFKSRNGIFRFLLIRGSFCIAQSNFPAYKINAHLNNENTQQMKFDSIWPYLLITIIKYCIYSLKMTLSHFRFVRNKQNKIIYWITLEYNPHP